MEVVVGRAEVALACVGQWLSGELAPVVPSADDNRAWSYSRAAHRLFESEPIEDSRRVGTYLDAGADLAQFGGLLEDLDLEPSASKRQRRGEAADPGADYYDSHVCSAPLQLADESSLATFFCHPDEASNASGMEGSRTATRKRRRFRF